MIKKILVMVILIFWLSSCWDADDNKCLTVPCPWQELDLPVWAYPDEN